MNGDDSPRRRREDAPAFLRLARRQERTQGQVAQLVSWQRQAQPQIAELRERELIGKAVADALGKQVDQQMHGRFSRREQAIGAVVALGTLAQVVHAWLP